jgi:hypothetical protein
VPTAEGYEMKPSDSPDSGRAVPGGIAVVAVHGVADQRPRESARQIANLLTDLCPPGSYSAFREEEIRIPVEPLRVTEPRLEAAALDRDPVRPRWWSFEERNHDALTRHRRAGPPSDPGAEAPEAADDFEPPDLAFMRDQLRSYDPEPDGVFETVRLKGEHCRSGAPIHIYEAYWADLSRPATSVIAFFAELSQLLLHLPNLGRNALDYARAANPRSRSWRAFSWLHRWSIRWLVLFIACLNLTMASLILPVLSTRLMREGLATNSFGLAEVVARATLALAALGLTAWCLRLVKSVRGWVWVSLPALATGLGWATGSVVSGRIGAGRTITLEAWLLSAAVALALLRGYEELRPGALLTGGLALLITGGSLAFWLSTEPSTEVGCLRAGIDTIALVGAGLALVWRIHVPWMLVAILAGVLSAAGSGRGRRKAAWHTVWTAQATLALSSVLFANITLAAWDAVFTGLRGAIREDAYYALPAPWSPLVRPFCLPSSPLTVGEYIAQTINISASRAFIASTVALVLLLLLVVWSTFPAALVEAAPPRRQSKTADRMRGLGIWLTHGLTLIPAVVWMFPFLYVAVVAHAIRGLLDGSNCIADPASGKAVAAAGLLFLGLFAARFWLPGASGVLDVLLDVDNYLRQHPKRDTPRARIAARQASLLRFLVSPERSGHRYSAIVIVAHSQGTVITAELLRFLRHETGRRSTATGPLPPWMAALASQDVAFLTMGCPLRQLYARAFPWLYQWVREPSAGQPASPHPRDLGVRVWVNAYRSGDYVGRQLWRGAGEAGVWDRRSHDPQNTGAPDSFALDSGRCQEMCIGEGAHTHYWDHQGADIAHQIDRLISARIQPPGADDVEAPAVGGR